MDQRGSKAAAKNKEKAPKGDKGSKPQPSKPVSKSNYKPLPASTKITLTTEMKVADGIKDVLSKCEKKLATQRYLGGNQPTSEDAETWESIKSS